MNATLITAILAIYYIIGGTLAYICLEACLRENASYMRGYIDAYRFIMRPGKNLAHILRQFAFIIIVTTIAPIFIAGMATKEFITNKIQR